MHGFKDNLNFGFLRGLQVQQICLGQYQTQIRLYSDANISMEGPYVHEITSEHREILQGRSACGPNELFRLLGESVTEVLIVSTKSLKLSFSNGDTLTLTDDSEQYESFVIGHKQGLFVI